MGTDAETHHIKRRVLAGSIGDCVHSLGVETPTMDEVIAWAGAQLGKDTSESRIPQKYGLRSLEALIAFVT